MISMTYGELPTEEQFVKAFEEYCPDGKYSFGNDKRVGNDTLTCSELWNEVITAVKEWNDDSNYSAGEWCSCVLSTLGYEWI